MPALVWGCDACKDSDLLRDDLKGAFQQAGPPPGVSISSTPKAVPEEDFTPRTRIERDEGPELAPRQAAGISDEAFAPKAKKTPSFLRSFQDY